MQLSVNCNFAQLKHMELLLLETALRNPALNASDISWATLHAAAAKLVVLNQEVHVHG